MKKTMLSTKQSYLVCFIGILAAFGIVMALCESGLADSYIKGIMMTACIAIIMTTSLNLTIGVLGQLTLGCCGFEAIGAYVAALTSKYMVAAGIAIDPTARFLLTTLIGGVVACVFGILIGIPALRLHGDYLAIITLGFGEIIRVIIQNLKVAGGMGLDKGAAGQALIGIERTANLYVVFWIMVVTVVVLFMFGRSRYGRAVKASATTRSPPAPPDSTPRTSRCSSSRSPRSSRASPAVSSPSTSARSTPPWPVGSTPSTT